MVIFGIFVAISYSIFNGSLQPALANIFSDSLDVASKKLKFKKNYLLNPNFNYTKGWKPNEFSKITAIGNKELLIEKDSFTEGRGGLFLDKNNYFIADLNKKYSASIEIFIEEYIVDSENLIETNGYFSTFYLRTRLKEGSANDFGRVIFTENNMKIGKWTRLEIEEVSPHINSEPVGNIQFSISIDRNAKAKIRVRNPILYINS